MLFAKQVAPADSSFFFSFMNTRTYTLGLRVC
jgi:hypothetical protein